jgi:hypothetical protein
VIAAIVAKQPSEFTRDDAITACAHSAMFMAPNAVGCTDVMVEAGIPELEFLGMFMADWPYMGA